MKKKTQSIFTKNQEQDEDDHFALLQYLNS